MIALQPLNKLNNCKNRLELILLLMVNNLIKLLINCMYWLVLDLRINIA